MTKKSRSKKTELRNHFSNSNERKNKMSKNLTKDGNLKYFSSTNSSINDSKNIFVVQDAM